jgi:hypothetical protein
VKTHVIRGRSLTETRTPPEFPARPAFMFHPDRPCKDGTKWTSDDKKELGEAARLCRKLACPVLQECGQWAVENGEKHHVWGGLNFGTAEMHAVVEQAAGRKPGTAGRKPNLPIDQQVRELWAEGLNDSTIALRLDKTPTDISKLRKRLGLAALYGPGGRRLETAAA